MKTKLEQLKKSALEALEKIKTAEELREYEIKIFGRKGEFNALTKELGALPIEERKEMGQLANEMRAVLENAIREARRGFEEEKLKNISETEWIDKTLPGKKPELGHLHIITQAIDEISAIFERLGFVRRRYPEIEWDWYSFEALNMPKDHPARDEWETFFIDAPEGPKGKMVLTPHTSSGQIREMERGELPIRMINISKCYRRQSDVTHVPMFHQFEGLLIDKNVSIAHLKGTLDYFAREFFGPTRVTRLRPFHFRFTEPSFEIDISCDVCGGTGIISPERSKNVFPRQAREIISPEQSMSKLSPERSIPQLFPERSTPSISPERSSSGVEGLPQKCRVCKQGWLELGGAGMVHPNVLRAGDIDPAQYNGFAFGWGVERAYMMKEGIDDIRILYKNDLRFIRQF